MRLLILGLGYSAARVAALARAQGAVVVATTRDGRSDTIAFADSVGVETAIASATHILSSIPPEGEADPALATYGDALARFGGWLGYLSSTGVYGDSGGAWVDEGAPIGAGRRSARAVADAAWLALGARVFRLPGIYGAGRSPLERVAAGMAHRVDVPGQVFSRIHVEDLASGVVAGFAAPPGAYNLADDLPAPQSDVIAHAARLMGVPVPPLVSLEQAGLSPAARAFYSENRRVANGKAKRVLSWRPRYPDYFAGLRALSASTRPAIASTPPSTADTVQ